MQLLVRNFAGRTAALDVEYQCNIAAVKALIEGIEGVPAEEQILFHGGKLLSNETSVLEAGLFHGASLQLSSRLRGGKPVKVKMMTSHLPCGEEVTIDIEPSASKNEIKYKLAEVTGVPVEHQKVMLSGVNQIVMGDKRTNIGYTTCGTANGVQMAAEAK